MVNWKLGLRRSWIVASGCWVVGLPLYVYRPGQPPRRLLGDYGDEVVLFGMVAGPILLLLVARLVVWAKNPPANETRGMRCIWNVSRFEAQFSPNISRPIFFASEPQAANKSPRICERPPIKFRDGFGRGFLLVQTPYSRLGEAVRRQDWHDTHRTWSSYEAWESLVREPHPRRPAAITGGALLYREPEGEGRW